MFEHEREQLSFEQLLEKYEPMIRSIAYSVGGANDELMLQEIRIGVWEATERYVPGKGQLGAYMKKKAWGRAMKYKMREQRYHYRHPNPTVTDGEGSTEFLIDLLPSQMQPQSSETESLIYLLDKLSLPERAVIVAFYYYGYGIAEIAERFKEPIETIRSRKRRGLTKLKSIIVSNV